MHILISLFSCTPLSLDDTVVVIERLYFGKDFKREKIILFNGVKEQVNTFGELH